MPVVCDLWVQVKLRLASLAVFLSEQPTKVENEPEFLFNAVWAFAQAFDRAYLHIVKCQANGNS